MADDVFIGEPGKCNSLDSIEHLSGMGQARLLSFRQVYLCRITGDHGCGSKSDTCQKHLHLFTCRVLCFIENNKSIIECSAPHEGEGCHFDDISLYVFGYRFKSEHFIKRVIEGP